MPKGQHRYTDVEREEIVRRVKAGATIYAVAAATGLPESTVRFWVWSAEKGRRYKDVEKEEVVRRVRAGESRNAVAAATGVPPSTVGYWVKIAGDGSARGGGKAGKAGEGMAGKKAGRPRPSGAGGETISWALDGDELVVRIPLGRLARRAAALQVLAEIKRELGR